MASINIFKEEGIIEHARHLGDDIVGPALAEMAERHPSVGEVRGLGVFWAIELVRDRATREPLVPYNASGPANAPMAEFAGACKDRGLWPFVHFNRTHVVPPITISDDEMTEGLAIIDEALDRRRQAHRRGLTQLFGRCDDVGVGKSTKEMDADQFGGYGRRRTMMRGVVAITPPARPARRRPWRRAAGSWR